MQDTPFVVAGRTFASRLIVGTAKYGSLPVMAQAHAASGADMVTVAVRRVNLSDRSRESLLDYINTNHIFILPNTAGCNTAVEAIRTAHLAREAGLSNWIKLEVIGDERTLFPDNVALIEATRVLANDGFVVLPYTNDDPIACRTLEDAGAAAVMPLGARKQPGCGLQCLGRRVTVEPASQGTRAIGIAARRTGTHAAPGTVCVGDATSVVISSTVTNKSAGTGGGIVQPVAGDA